MEHFPIRDHGPVWENAPVQRCQSMSEPSFEVSERARALRNPAKTGPLVYYPSGWGTGHTERSAGPTMVGPADRSQPPPWSARLSFPAFSFPFLRSFLSSSFFLLPSSFPPLGTSLPWGKLRPLEGSAPFLGGRPTTMCGPAMVEIHMVVGTLKETGFGVVPAL